MATRASGRLLLLSRPGRHFSSSPALRRALCTLTPATRHQLHHGISLLNGPARSTKLAVGNGFRRSYADAVVPPTVSSSLQPPPPPPKRKRFRFFRWTWRLILLSILGTTGWAVYNVYQHRNPADQVPPDPDKKTLVILGMYIHYFNELQLHKPQYLTQLLQNRNRMGLCISPEETWYRKLQCRRHLTAKFLLVYSPSAIMYHWFDRASFDHGAHQEHSPP